MKTIHKGMVLTQQSLAPNLPSTIWQPQGAGAFFDLDPMRKINIYTPITVTQDPTKFYPYFFNVNVVADTSTAENKTIMLDIQVKDETTPTHVSVLRGAFTGAFKTVGSISTGVKHEAEVYLADDANKDFLGVCAGLQNNAGNYGIVVYIRGGLKVTGFSNAHRVQACGANDVSVDFAGVTYDVGIDTMPINTLNRRNLFNVLTSGNYTSNSSMYSVNQEGVSTPLELGGSGSGSGITPPIISSTNTVASVGVFHLLDLRGGGLVYTLPTVEEAELEYGDTVRVGDYLDSATLLTPIQITSDEMIHGESDDTKKSVWITSPARMVWQWLGGSVGWYCVDATGEGANEVLPYEEVEILAFDPNRLVGNGSLTLPSGYTFDDFERLEYGMNLSYSAGAGSLHAVSETPRNVLSSGAMILGRTTYTASNISEVKASITLRKTSENTLEWDDDAAAPLLAGLAFVTGYTRYRPTVEKPKRVTTLYEGPVILNGQDVPLSESIGNFDMILIEGHFNNGTEIHTSTMMIRPEDILTSGSVLNVWRYSASSTNYINIILNPTLSSDVSLRVAASSVTFTNPGITKVSGVNFVAQNIISGNGGGGGKSPHVVKTTDFDIEFDTNYAIDMSDGVSKTALLKTGFQEGNWFKITVIGVTPGSPIEGAFITIDTPFNGWSYNPDAPGFKFPAKSNSSYEVQVINGLLTIINASGGF